MEENQIPVWEASKENVLPIKKGRKMLALNETLQQMHNLDIQKDLMNQEQVFESMLQSEIVKSKECNSKSRLLDIYLQYYKWTCDSFPSSNEKALRLLERCTVDLKDDDTLKNDPNLVKCWIEYADMVQHPNDIFAFMNANKIGSKVALYWVAWAFVAEKSKNFKLTDQIFQKGLRYLAEPKELLQKRYQQFQRRLARHYLNMQENGEEEASNTQNNERKPLAVKQISILNENGIQQIPQQSSKSSKPKAVPLVNSNKSFDIFSDSGVSSSEALESNSNWKNLATSKNIHKENERKVAKWTEAPLPQLLPTIQSRPPIASIPIFVDEECQQIPVIKTEPSNHLHAGLSVRKVLESETDISIDPLARHKRPKVSNDEEKQSLQPVETKKPHMPFEIFSENMPSTVPTSIASNESKLCNKIPFQIFQDNQQPSKPSKMPMPIASTTPFQIFDDMKSMNKSTEEDDEDDNFGATINTRLAMRDIDSMFCSPSATNATPSQRAKKSTNSKSYQPFIATQFQAINDISAIQESSKEEFSIFGHLQSNTPQFK